MSPQGPQGHPGLKSWEPKHCVSESQPPTSPLKTRDTHPPQPMNRGTCASDTHRAPDTHRRAARNAKVSFTIDRYVKVYRDDVREAVQRSDRLAAAQ